MLIYCPHELTLIRNANVALPELKFSNAGEKRYCGEFAVVEILTLLSKAISQKIPDFSFKSGQ